MFRFVSFLLKVRMCYLTVSETKGHFSESETAGSKNDVEKANGTYQKTTLPNHSSTST